jgi:hypothetical protein
MHANTPQELIGELMRRAEDGEPVVLVPIDQDGEPNGSPVVSWPDPHGRRLN